MLPSCSLSPAAGISVAKPDSAMSPDAFGFDVVPDSAILAFDRALGGGGLRRQQIDEAEVVHRRADRSRQRGVFAGADRDVPVEMAVVIEGAVHVDGTLLRIEFRRDREIPIRHERLLLRIRIRDRARRRGDVRASAQRACAAAREVAVAVDFAVEAQRRIRDRRISRWLSMADARWRISPASIGRPLARRSCRCARSPRPGTARRIASMRASRRWARAWRASTPMRLSASVTTRSARLASRFGPSPNA